MNRILLYSTLLSVVALSYSSLAGHDRYGSQHSRNSLSHNQGRYPSAPHSPRTPVAPRAPLHSASHSYGAPRSSGYGAHQQSRGVHHAAPRQNIHRSAPSSHHSAPSNYQSNAGLHYSAPSHYGGGRHFAPSGPSLNHYSGPSHFPGPLPYGGQAHEELRHINEWRSLLEKNIDAYINGIHSRVIGLIRGATEAYSNSINDSRNIKYAVATASADSSHYSSSQRSVYNQPQESSSYSTSSRSNYPQQNFAHSTHNSQAQSTAHGREMKYTIKDPHNRGMTHVTETHVVSNRQMHGAEAEAAMQKLMGSMGSSPGSGFDDFFKGMGLPFY